MTGFIKLTVIEDDNGELKFRIDSSNNRCMTTLDFYGNNDDFKEFPSKLIDFPKSKEDIVTFELGEDNRKWAYYMIIKAFCYDDLGHSAIKIIVDNFGDTSTGYRTEFSIITEPSSLNRLGQQLFAWNPYETKEIIWESDNLS